MGGASKGISNIGNSLTKVVTNPTKLQLKDIARINPTTGMAVLGAEAAGIDTDKLFKTPSGVTKTQYGDFAIDPDTVAADQKSINDLGQSQYNQTLQGIQDVGAADTKRANELFTQMLPDIAENAQASHLYDSTGYGQEVARQQSNIASQVANQEAQAKLQALSPLQNMQQQALSRGFSLNDFVRQANVAKTIGAISAPQVGNGKGTAVAGLGAGAEAGKPFGPWGSAIGGASGAYLGSGRGK